MKTVDYDKFVRVLVERDEARAERDALKDELLELRKAQYAELDADLDKSRAESLGKQFGYIASYDGEPDGLEA